MKRSHKLTVLARRDARLSPERIRRLWAEEAARRAREILDGSAREVEGGRVMARARALLS